MPGPEVTPGPRGQGPVWRLARPAAAPAGVVVVQVLLASVFAGVAHQAPVAGRSPLAPVVSGHGGRMVRLAAEPAAGAARAAFRAGHPELMARFQLGFFQAAREGHFAGIGPLLGDLLGHQPRTVRDLLAGRTRAEAPSSSPERASHANDSRTANPRTRPSGAGKDPAGSPRM
jgi:NAD(P)H dehydrogenase (quinone)